MTEADIDPASLRDLYVSMGEPVGHGGLGGAPVPQADGALDLGGGALMTLGGFSPRPIAATGRHRAIACCPDSDVAFPPNRGRC